MHAIRRTAIALAALLAAGASVVASPASAQTLTGHTTAAVRAAQPIRNCGADNQVFGPIEGFDKHAWTQVSGQFCLNSDTENTIYPELKYHDCDYYWFAAWYGSSQEYPCAATFSYTLYDPNGYWFGGGTIGPLSVWGTNQLVGSTRNCDVSGTYTLEGHFEFDGPYWSPEVKTKDDTVTGYFSCNDSQRKQTRPSA